jgi:hypothetical protein
MKRSQRIVLVLYCLLVVYCCLWVPWHVVHSPAFGGAHQFRTGYGWLWVGPSDPNLANTHATPDLPIISLRLLVVTALAGAALATTRK